MKTVGLTQYMRPDGRKHFGTFDLPDEAAAKAEGMLLTCEILRTGEVVFYAGWADDDPDVVQEALALTDYSTDARHLQAALIKAIESKWQERHPTEPATG